MHLLLEHFTYFVGFHCERDRKGGSNSINFQGTIFDHDSLPIVHKFACLAISKNCNHEWV